MLLQHIVRAQAERRPDAVAIVCQDQSMTYRELEDSSSQLAWLLLVAGCKKGDRVGILASPSIAGVVSLLAVLNAGCIGVPMDTASTPAGLARVLEICEPRLILATSQAEGLLNALISEGQVSRSVSVGWLESAAPPDPWFDVAFSWDDLATMPVLHGGLPGSREDLAYLVLSPAAAAVPKAVMVAHSNLTQFLQWAARQLDTANSDKISCYPPLSDDLCLFDIFGTFLAGAQLHLVPPGIRLAPRELADFLRQSELTQWLSRPSVLRRMAEADAVSFNAFPSLKRLIWCREALPASTLAYWMKRLPAVTFTYLYGPTETVIAASYNTVRACPSGPDEEIPIGSARDGEDLLVLDKDLRPVTPGPAGDLYIRGPGLSLGYWKDPQQTKTAFITDPETGTRMFRTGELARTGPDGLTYLVGPGVAFRKAG